jgi:hypothetical protein
VESDLQRSAERYVGKDGGGFFGHLGQGDDRKLKGRLSSESAEAAMS